MAKNNQTVFQCVILAFMLGVGRKLNYARPFHVSMAMPPVPSDGALMVILIYRSPGHLSALLHAVRRGVRRRYRPSLRRGSQPAGLRHW